MDNEPVISISERRPQDAHSSRREKTRQENSINLIYFNGTEIVRITAGMIPRIGKDINRVFMNYSGWYFIISLFTSIRFAKL